MDVTTDIYPDDIEEAEALGCWLERQLDPYWSRVDREMEEWKGRPE